MTVYFQLVDQSWDGYVRRHGLQRLDLTPVSRRVHATSEPDPIVAAEYGELMRNTPHRMPQPFGSEHDFRAEERESRRQGVVPCYWDHGSPEVQADMRAREEWRQEMAGRERWRRQLWGTAQAILKRKILPRLGEWRR
jgi:hypothetical protein